MRTIQDIVDSRYGAPMGRPDKTTTAQDASTKFNLQRIPINSQGYDSGGAYWGVGQRLYWTSNQDSTIESFFRAKDRAAAKAFVRVSNPTARFFR